MKILKWIAILLVIFVLLIAAAVLTLLNSSGIQKSILMGQLEGKVDHIELDYIKANFSTVTVKGLVLDQDGTLIELPNAELDYSLTKAIFDSELRISKMDVTDLVVTLPEARKRLPVMGPGPVQIPKEEPIAKPEPKPEPSRPAEKSSDEPPPPFKGLFTQAASPMKIYIDGVVMNAELKMTPVKTVTFKATGGGIEPGKTGAIEAEGSLKDGTATAAVQKMDLTATLKVSQTEDAHLNAIVLDTTTTAKGGTLKEPVKISVLLDLSANSSGIETYVLSINDGEPKDAIELKTTFEPQKKKLVGETRFSLQRNSLLPFVAGNKLPDFQALGLISYDLSSEDYSGTTKIQSDGFVTGLAKLDPKYKDFPNIDYKLNYNGAVSTDSIRINELLFSINQRPGNQILSIKLLQELLIGKDFDPEKLKGKIAEIKIDDLKTSWINPLVSDLDLIGGGLGGTLEIQADNGKATMRTTNPFVFKGVTVSSNGKEMLKSASLELRIDSSLTKDSYNFTISRLNAYNAKKRPLIEMRLAIEGKLKDSKPVDSKLSSTGRVYFKPLLEEPFSPQQLAKPIDMLMNLEATIPNEEIVNLKLFKTNLTGLGNETIALIELLKPLTLDIKNPDKNTPENLLKGEVMQVQLLSFPKPIVNAFLGDTEIKEGNITANMVVAGQGENIVITTKQPINISNLSVTQDNKPMLRNLNASLSPNIIHGPVTTTVNIPQISLKEGSNSLVSGRVAIVATPKGDNPVKSLDLDLDSNLAQLLKQPTLAKYNNISAGSAKITANITNPNNGAFDVKVDAKDLSVVEPAGTIKTLSLSTKGKLQMPKHVTIDAPLKILGPNGLSEAALKGWVNPNDNPMAFQLDTTGNTIYLEDLQLLAAAFKKPVTPSPAGTAPAPGQSAPSNQPTPQPSVVAGKTSTSPAGPPPWAGYKGKASLKVNKVVQGEYSVEKINAAVSVDPQTVLLKPATAEFMGAPMDATVKVDHVPAQRPQKPYGLDTTFSLAKFDVGKYLTMNAPNSPPKLTGLFTATGNARGIAPELETIADELQGSFTLKGGPGRLSALAGMGEGTNEVLGIAGALIGNRAKEIPQLISLLQEIEYDTFLIEARRGQNLNIDLSTFLLQGPEVRLAGKGQVTHKNGIPVQEQPLGVAVALDSKGKVADLMNKLGMVTGSADKSGYFPGPSFSIGGTPANPDFSDLYSIITSATAGAIGNIINSATGGSSNSSDDDSTTKPSAAEEAVKGVLNLFGN